MPKSSFACPQCGRRFKMAAHLARHMNTMHGAGRRAKRSKFGKAVAAIGHSFIEGVHGLTDALHAARDRIAQQREHLATQLAAQN